MVTLQSIERFWRWKLTRSYLKADFWDTICYHFMLLQQLQEIIKAWCTYLGRYTSEQEGVFETLLGCMLCWMSHRPTSTFGHTYQICICFSWSPLSAMLDAWHPCEAFLALDRRFDSFVRLAHIFFKIEYQSTNQSILAFFQFNFVYSWMGHSILLKI